MAYVAHRVEITLDELSYYWARGGRAGRLNRKTYMMVTATLFLIVAIMHLLRIIFGWQVEIGGLSIPFWASCVGVLVAGALAYFGFSQTRYSNED